MRPNAHACQMPNIPQGFPYRLDDEALRDSLGSFSDMIGRRYDSFDGALPELQLALISSGMLDLTRRETLRIAKWSLLVASLALLIRLAALVVALAR